MNMGGGSNAPSPPDPTATAQAQAQANRVGVLSPTGSQYYGRFQPIARPDNVSEADWNARPFQDRYSFQVDPDHDVTQIVETPAQQQFRTGSQDLAQSLLGRATTQLGNLPTQALDFSGAPSAISSVRAPTGLQTSIADPGAFQGNIADAGGINRTIDMSGILPVQQRLSLMGLQNLPGLGDFSGDAQRTQEASFGRAMRLLQPQFARQEASNAQMLADRGLPMGGEASNEVNRQFAQNRDNAMLSAAQDAIGAGSAEQSRLFGLALGARQQGVQERQAQGQFGLQSQGQLFGQRATQAGFGNQAQAQQFGQSAAQVQAANEARNQQLAADLARAQFANTAQQQQFGNELTAANFQNQARNQNINETMLRRGNSFNELAALLGGPQIGAPTALNPTPIDVAGPQALAYQGQLANYNQAQRRAAGTAGGLFGLGGSILGVGLMPGGIFR